MANKKTEGKDTFAKNVDIVFKEVVYKAYKEDTNKNSYLFLTESVGIKATSRLLSISKTTVIKRIKMMVSKIQKPILKREKSIL